MAGRSDLSRAWGPDPGSAWATEAASPSGRERLRWLAGELAARHGRGGSVMRMTFSSTLIVLIWMVFEMPFPAYAAYVVLLLCRTESATTLLAAAGSLAAITVSIVLVLIAYTLSAGNPALRIPLMGGFAFVGMYLSRRPALGPLIFLTGFLFVTSLTLVDDVPNLEGLTRLALWLWLVVAVPVLVVTLVEQIAAPPPLTYFRRRAAELFDQLTGCLAGRRGPSVPDIDRALADLQDSLRSAARVNTRVAAGSATLQHRLAVMRRMAAATNLASDGLMQPARQAIVAALERMTARLDTVSDGAGDAHGGVPADASPDAPHGNRVLRAERRREDLRFALKAALAVMLVYVAYNLVAWPGIRTAVVTCFFVALDSVGATVHKLTLRLAGALTGGLCAGLCIAFVLPHATDVGDLLLLMSAATALFAWVGTSSDRLAYAGLQAAFAFYIGVLQTYGPADDLTVLRDRVAGIVLGNVAMSLVFTTLWPVPIVRLARQELRRALKACATRLGRPPYGLGDDSLAPFGRARRLLELERFESFPGRADPPVPAAGFDALYRLFGALIVAEGLLGDLAGHEALHDRHARLSRWVSDFTSALADGRPLPVPPDDAASPGAPPPTLAPGPVPEPPCEPQASSDATSAQGHAALAAQALQCLRRQAREASDALRSPARRDAPA